MFPYLRTKLRVVDRQARAVSCGAGGDAGAAEGVDGFAADGAGDASGVTSATSSQPSAPPAPARPPRRRPLPAADQAPARARRPHQRIRRHVRRAGARRCWPGLRERTRDGGRGLAARSGSGRAGTTTQSAIPRRAPFSRPGVDYRARKSALTCAGMVHVASYGTRGSAQFAR